MIEYQVHIDKRTNILIVIMKALSMIKKVMNIKYMDTLRKVMLAALLGVQLIIELLFQGMA
jgi:hypothetical protein